MERNGIKLYGEADKFNFYASTLAAYLRPPNSSEVNRFASIASTMVHALRDKMIESLNSRQDAGPGTVEQKRKNYTISQLRDLGKKYGLKYMHAAMKRNLWKP